MNEAIITTIIVTIATLVASALGALFTQEFKIINDRRSDRVYPSVSIWDSRCDSIQEKLQKVRTARWFLNDKEIKALRDSSERFLFIYIRPIDVVKMCDCCVDTCVTCQDEEGRQPAFRTIWHIGRLSSERSAVLPVSLSSNIFGRHNMVEIDIFYQTQTDEKLRYSIVFSYNKVNGEYSFRNRKDTLFVYKRKKYKKIKECNKDMATNTSADLILGEIPFSDCTNNELSKKGNDGVFDNTPEYDKTGGNNGDNN